MKHSRAQEIREFWKTKVLDWRKSGLTQIAYSTKHDIKNHQLSYWSCKLKNVTPNATKSKFIPLTVTQNEPKAHRPGCRLTLPGGIAIEFDQQPDQIWLANFIKGLRG